MVTHSRATLIVGIVSALFFAFAPQSAVAVDSVPQLICVQTADGPTLQYLSELSAYDGEIQELQYSPVDENNTEALEMFGSLVVGRVFVKRNTRKFMQQGADRRLAIWSLVKDNRALGRECRDLRFAEKCLGAEYSPELRKWRRLSKVCDRPRYGATGDSPSKLNILENFSIEYSCTADQCTYNRYPLDSAGFLP